MHLVPANAAAAAPYSLIHSALQNSGKWALGRVVLSNRRQLVVVCPTQLGLVLHTLYDPAQVRAAVVPTNGAAEPSPRELKTLTKAFTSKNGPVRWADFVDDTETRLASLVSRKVRATTRQVLKVRGGKRNGAPKAARRSKSRSRRKAA
jgi:non-homologous end joining protein Ku